MPILCLFLTGQSILFSNLLLTTESASAQTPSGSLWPVQLGANANVNVAVDGTDAFYQLTGFNNSSNPMAVLVSEDGGRYEETEVNITYKQGEIDKSPYQDASYTPSSSSQAMRCGSQGVQVAELQRQLKTLGFFQHDVTGYFGDITKDAVAKFQNFRGLAVDGVVGPQTLDALEKLLNTQQIVNTVPIVPNVDYAVVTPASSGRMLVQPVTQATVVPINPSTAQVVPFSARTSTPQSNPPVAAANPATSIDGAKVGTELYIGSQGQLVRDIQTLLKQSGRYSGPVTGYFGPLTAVAIENFQSSRGLAPTGIVGEKTLVELYEASN